MPTIKMVIFVCILFKVGKIKVILKYLFNI